MKRSSVIIIAIALAAAACLLPQQSRAGVSVGIGIGRLGLWSPIRRPCIPPPPTMDRPYTDRR